MMVLHTGMEIVTIYPLKIYLIHLNTKTLGGSYLLHIDDFIAANAPGTEYTQIFGHHTGFTTTNTLKQEMKC